MVLPSKVYDVLKWILTIAVPALISLITGLGLLYGFNTEIIIGTISLIATFCGSLVGISCKNFNKQEE